MDARSSRPVAEESGTIPAGDDRAPATVVLIEADRRGFLVDFAELWRFREVVFFLVWRDFKVRYRQTVLGAAWAILQPLASTGVFTLVFGKLVGVPTGGIPYAALALSGVVPWTYFSRTLSAMTGSLTGNREMISRVYFPRMAIPLSTLLSALVELAVGFVLLAACSIWFTLLPPLQVILLPLFLAQMMASALGAGLILAATNVRYRDVGYIVPFAIQILLFLTPVVYPSSLLPDGLRILAGLNPMTGVLEGMRWCLFGLPPSWPAIGLSAVVTLVLLVAGLHWFARSERSFADVI